jgi:hypothetical protein
MWQPFGHALLSTHCYSQAYKDARIPICSVEQLVSTIAHYLNSTLLIPSFALSTSWPLRIIEHNLTPSLTFPFPLSWVGPRNGAYSHSQQQHCSWSEPLNKNDLDLHELIELIQSCRNDTIKHYLIIIRQNPQTRRPAKPSWVELG